MSKDKIHIDDLFKQLKGYEHTIDGGFSEVNDKLHDTAWQEKFNDYEHAVSDIPEFGALPMAKSDRGSGLKAAGKYLLLVALIGVLSFGSYTAYDSIRESNTHAQTKESVVKNKPISSNQSASKGDDLNNSLGKNEASPSIPSENASSLDTKNNSIHEAPEGRNNIQSNDGSGLNKHLVVGISNKKDPKPSKIRSSEHSVYSKPNPSEKKEPEGPNVEMREQPIIGINKAETGGKTQTGFAENLSLNQRGINRLLGISNELASTSAQKYKDVAPPKPPISYYGQIGLGVLNPNSPFTNANPSAGLTYQAHLGIQYRRLNIYTGLERSNYEYQTTLRKLQLYDSFPHLGPGGDTIGWFKKNFRDTTINQVNSSQVIINTIPLHFQFKALQVGKANLSLGTGLNINLINRKTLWFKDADNYLVNHAASGSNAAKFNLGMSLMARVGYRITPLIEVYSRFNIREAGNILNSNTQSLKPSGTQLDFGIRYHLK